MEKKSLMRLIAVTAVICTGYTCYAQIDTIRISTSFTTHVIFTSDLSYVDLSNSRIVAAKIIDQNKNILALKARDRFTENTSVSALESDGTMHTFIIAYEESPSELVLDLRSMILEKTDREQRHGKPDRTVPDMKELMSGKQRLFHIGDRKYRLTALCEDIVQTNDATYVVLSLRNSSSTGFTTSDATFVIEDRKRHKRAVRIEKSIFPSTSFGSLSAAGGAFSKAVYSFDKLTISKDQVLKIYIYEEGGQRNLEMTISAKEINR